MAFDGRIWAVRNQEKCIRASRLAYWLSSRRWRREERRIGMSNPTVYVRMDIEIQVDLPDEGPIDDGEGEPTPEARERAIEAALAAISQNCQVFIDGEENDPAEVFCDKSDSDVTEVRCE
jgi:hypothetical protein